MLNDERRSGQARSALLVLRDCWEATTKLLVIALAADIARARSCAGVRSELADTVAGLLRKPPAMGDWVECLVTLADAAAAEASCELGLVPELVTGPGKETGRRRNPLLRRLLKSLWDAVAWRNDSIGHGAVGQDVARLAGEVDLQSARLGEVLASMPFLRELEVTSSAPDGAVVSWNGVRAASIHRASQTVERAYPVWLRRGEVSAHAGPLLIAAGSGREVSLLTFDKATNWPFFLDYFLGTKVRLPWLPELDAFRRISSDHQRAAAMATFVRDQPLDTASHAYRGSLSRALRHVEFGGDRSKWYVKPEALFRALELELDRFAANGGAGCWHLVGGAGTGKSWFAAALGDPAMWDHAAEVVTYHFRIGFRQNANVLISELTEQVGKPQGHDVVACRIRLEEFERPHQAVAAFLGDVLARSAQDRLVLVVDGLDEVTDPAGTSISPLDLLPLPDELPEGVLLVVTSRPEPELGPRARAYVEQLQAAGGRYQRFDIDDTVVQQQETIKGYLRFRHGVQQPEVLSRILKSSGVSFLRASLLGRVYGLAGAPEALDDVQELNDLYARYLELVRSHTGATLFDGLHVRLIALMAVSPRPLTLDELSTMLGYHDERIVFAMFDTATLFDGHRGEEHRFSPSHAELTTFALDRLAHEIRGRLWDVVQMSQGDELLLDWLIDVATYLTRTGRTSLASWLNEQLVDLLPPQHARRAEVLVNVADLVHIGGRYREAIGRLAMLADHLLKVERRPPHDPEVVRAQLRRAHHLKFVAPIHEARAVVDSLLDCLPEGPARLEARFLAAGSVGCLDVPGAAQLEELERVAAQCRLTDPYLWTRCMRRAADLQLSFGDADRALETAETALETARGAVSRQEVYLHATIGEVHRYKGEMDAARRRLQTCLSLSASRRLPGWEGHGALALAELARMSNDVDEALRRLDQAERCYHEADDMLWGRIHADVVRYFLNGHPEHLARGLEVAEYAGYRADIAYLTGLAGGAWTPAGHNRHFLLFP
jgi:tetratricopeptide (TPR) repeat protein